MYCWATFLWLSNEMDLWLPMTPICVSHCPKAVFPLWNTTLQNLWYQDLVFLYQTKIFFPFTTNVPGTLLMRLRTGGMLEHLMIKPKGCESISIRWQHLVNKFAIYGSIQLQGYYTASVGIDTNSANSNCQNSRMAEVWFVQLHSKKKVQEKPLKLSWDTTYISETIMYRIQIEYFYKLCNIL